jgi:hypothetical protein
LDFVGSLRPSWIPTLPPIRRRMMHDRNVRSGGRMERNRNDWQ